MAKSNTKRVLPDLTQMQELMEKLIAENQALKDAAKKAPAGRALKGITLESYTPPKGGKPIQMVGFDIGGMPFSLSFKKCKAVLDNADKVRAVIKAGEKA